MFDLLNVSLENLTRFLVSELLPPKALEQLDQGNIAAQFLRPVAQLISDISSSYTAHHVGALLKQPVISDKHAEAYALYYTLINAAKIIHLTKDLSLPQVTSILDIGCGPGTALLALLTGRQETFRYTAVESSPAMLETAQRLANAWQPASRLAGLRYLKTLPKDSEQYDLAIAANVLAELESGEGDALASNLITKVAPGGHLVLIEPGQLLHTRRLMAIRDRILRTGSDLKVIFPCTRTTDCPMLTASSTDWCHGTLSWQRPRLVQQFDELLGFNKHRIKYSAFMFSREGITPDGYRVLTPPEKLPRGIETLLCGKDYYGVVRIARKARSEANRPLEKAAVYQRVLVSNQISADIKRDTLVSIAGERIS